MIDADKKKIIKKEIPIPRYYQLAEYIRKQVQAEKLAPGSPLWSERKLMSQHKISLATVRKAYEVLAEEGLVIKEHGKGVFVAEKAGATVTLRVLLDTMILPEKVWKKIIAAFNEENPHIKIDSIFVAGQKVWRDHIERFAPDIYCLDESFWHVLKRKELLLDMKELASQDRASLEGIYENVFNSFKVKDEIYGIPYRFSTFAVIYNKELFRQEKVPFPENTTWESFLELAKRMTVRRSNGSVKHYGFISNSNINHISIFARQNNGEISPFTSKRGFESREVKDAVKFWYYDMLHTHNVSPEWGIVDAFNLFIRGKVAMFTERYYSAVQLNKKSDFEWGVVPLPKGKKRASSLPAQALSIAKKTKSVASAWSFIKFVADLKTQKRFAQNGWGLPSQRLAAEELPFSEVFVDELKYASPAWPYEFNEPRDIIKDELSLLRLKLHNADVTCNKIARQFCKFVEKLRRKDGAKHAE